MSTKGKEYKLAIRIAGKIDKSFGRSLSTANSTLRATVSSINTDFTRLDKGFDSIMKTGKKCFSAIATAAKVAAAAVAAATFASLSVGSEFESAFAGVKKTVDATEEEFTKLRQDIIDMSKEIPSSASEIAEVMEIAGQLGIAKDSLTDFTRTMINMGVSTNLEAATAADMLARFANVTNMANYDENGISNYERLGSVVVDLGNNFATTEEEIVTMATNLAAAGDMVGLSQAQIMALATAMSATGIKAEKGGSAMSKLLKKIQIAVETNSEALNDYAAVANMTGEQFAQTFTEDSIVALSAFIEGLNDTERNGASAIAVLDDMGLSEVRLSDVILRLSNSEGIMTDAIEVANLAWEENTALSEEAGKRYETFGSQLEIMKNAFEALGIAVYDNLTRGSALETISNITESVNEFTENDLPGWINRISVAAPTMQRKVKAAWKAVSPFFNGLLNIGKWLVNNPDVIVGTIAGIGTALATYKIASTIISIVNALMNLISMNPITLGIMGVVSAFGLLAGAISGYKVHEQELIDENLAEHFGNIALSMKDIESIAEYIVSTDSLGGVKEALEAFEDLDGITSTMEEAIKEINKMNWKVSIGMELTKDENEEYKQIIDTYIQDAQEYALQSQYAVTLNLAVAFDEGNAESSNVVTKINQFYQDKYDELAALGTDLNNAVTEAFNDGLLEIDEANKVAEIQAQMAKIKEQLATSEFDATLSLLDAKYSGASLDADSFQNLIGEISEQVEAAQELYDESYVKNVASVNAAYDAGYLSDKEYQDSLDSLQHERLTNIANMEAQALAFLINTIMETYGDEVDAFNDVVRSVMDEYSSESYMEDWETQPAIVLDNLMQDIFNNDSIDSTTRKAIAELLEQMEPSVEQVEELKQQFAAIGEEIPEELNKALEDVDILGGMTAYQSFLHRDGDQDALYDFALNYMQDSEDYTEIVNLLKEYGWELPEAFSEGITEAQENIAPVIEDMYTWSQEKIDETFANGFDVNADVRLCLYPQLYGSMLNSPFNQGNLFIPGHADGGIFTVPHIAQFAEEGPEAAIPLDGSRNAISLWEQTGRLLGMESILDRYPIEDSGTTTTIEYSPTLQFYGEAPDKQDLEDALEVSQDKFDAMIERYFKTHGRVSFG